MPKHDAIFTPSLPVRAAERVLTVVMRAATRQYLSLKTTRLAAVPPPIDGHAYTLYAHVPFCESLCPYCSFNRFVLNHEKAAAYFASLRDEMRILARLGYRFTSLYFGGGTPTIMPQELADTIDLAHELFDIDEVSCETNPNHLNPQMVALLKDRVQRLSVGVQSFDDGLLKQMNRFQKFGSGATILESIRYAAPFFKSLNVDMIFNFPSQTPEILQEDIRHVIESGAQQVTFYPLMTSPSVRQSMKNSVGELTPNREADYYHVISEGLANHFIPLSAWTFARGGTSLIDEYIVDTEEYVGVGSGVFSYLDGKLYASTFSLKEYGERVAAGEIAITGVQPFSRQQQMRYRMMMDMFGLRFDRAAFKQRFGVPAGLGLWLEMAFFNLLGAFKPGDRAIPSPVGRYLSLVIMREFFTGVNHLRDIARASLTAEDRGETSACGPAVPLPGQR
ncbi:MAG: coproporphyrinogen III oxidase family protein [Anaerolineaceae bacterium]|jgi:coproporphyrinogen III oxidase-like Fe-S oxidoreductase